MTTLPQTDRRAELLEKLLRKRRLEEQAKDRISALPWTGTAPLSGQQQGLWLANELIADSTYNMIALMRLRGPFEVPALRTALAGLIGRHEGLRTSFVQQSGVPQLRVDPPPGRFWLEQLDVSEVPEPARWDRALQLLTDCCHQQIDLRSAPLLRVFLARLGPEDHLLGYVLHHIISDGWSMPILAGELSEFYRAAVEERPARLPELTIQPSDVYRWQHERLTADAVRQRLDRWRDRLAGLPPLQFPLDRPRPAAGSSAGRYTSVEFPAELLTRADVLARTTGRMPFAVMLAAFAVLLQQRTGQDDLAIGSVFSGRVRTEIEPLIGYFANTTVLRIRTAAEQPIDQLIGHCQDMLLEAQGMQDVPFADVVSAVEPVRVPGANPLFQICFTLSRSGVGTLPLAIDGVEVQPIDVGSQGSRFDLSFQVTEQADGSCVVVLEYATDLLDESTVLRLVADYRGVLQVMLAEPDLAGLSVRQLQQTTAELTESSPDRAAGSDQPAEISTGSAGPVTTEDLREWLSEIWMEVFEIAEDVRDDQNFFEVGGTSLAAVKLRSRIVSEFGVDIPLGDIFAGGSIAELLPKIEAGVASSLQ